MDVPCAMDLACDDSTGKQNTEKQETAMPCLNPTLNTRSESAAVSHKAHTSLCHWVPDTTEFNEPLTMCGLFIDGHCWG